MDTNYFARGFLFGLLLGWLYLNTRNTPPKKSAAQPVSNILGLDEQLEGTG